MELDQHENTWGDKRVLPIRVAIASFQREALIEQQKIPWLVHDNLRWVKPGTGNFRILVCGKAGVGMSKLINRVFGVNVVSHSRYIGQILLEVLTL